MNKILSDWLLHHPICQKLLKPNYLVQNDLYSFFEKFGVKVFITPSMGASSTRYCFEIHADSEYFAFPKGAKYDDICIISREYFGKNLKPFHRFDSRVEAETMAFKFAFRILERICSTILPMRFVKLHETCTKDKNTIYVTNRSEAAIVDYVQSEYGVLYKDPIISQIIANIVENYSNDLTPSEWLMMIAKELKKPLMPPTIAFIVSDSLPAKLGKVLLQEIKNYLSSTNIGSIAFVNETAAKWYIRQNYLQFSLTNKSL